MSFRSIALMRHEWRDKVTGMIELMTLFLVSFCCHTACIKANFNYARNTTEEYMVDSIRVGRVKEIDWLT